MVKLSLDERFALPMWVSAEVSEIKVNYSGHCYLELVEKGADDGLPTAQGSGGHLAQPVSAHLGPFRDRNGAAARRRYPSVGQSVGLVPRVVRFFVADHRHRPVVHRGRSRTATAADHCAVAAGRCVGDEPCVVRARGRAARSRRVECAGRRLSGLLQGVGQEPLPFRNGVVRCFHAGGCRRGFHRRGFVRGGRPAGGFRRRGVDSRGRFAQRSDLFRQLSVVHLCRAVSVARHHRHRSRQGYERRRHGGAYGAQNADCRGRLVGRPDGRCRGVARRGSFAVA